MSTSDPGAWLKFAHLFGAFSWMAGLFYLPRLLVYQRDASPESRALLAIMAQRLYRFIIIPSSHITLICGGALSWWGNYSGTWLYGKTTCVLLLFVFQLQLNRYRIQLAANPSFKSSRFFRVINEIPTLILLGILYFVVFKH